MSPDGIRWKRVNDGRPLLEPGQNDSLDNGQILAPEVLHNGRRYLMWYTGMPLERHESGIGYYRIFLAVSSDGFTWARANGGKPVLDIGPPDSPDAVQAATPAVIRDAGGYRMWYAAWSPLHSHTVCVARSNDGIVWRRDNEGQPVSGLDPAYAYGPAVTRYKDQYIMLYMGTAHSLYGAVSRDGIQWNMLNDGRPVLRQGARGAFDDAVVGHAFLTLEADTLRIWYTGYRQEPDGAGPWKLRIGLAEAELLELPFRAGELCGHTTSAAVFQAERSALADPCAKTQGQRKLKRVDQLPPSQDPAKYLPDVGQLGGFHFSGSSAPTSATTNQRRLDKGPTKSPSIVHAVVSKPAPTPINTGPGGGP